jgi:hypothetical protein
MYEALMHDDARRGINPTKLTWDWAGPNRWPQSQFERRGVDPFRENDIASLAHWVPREQGTCIRSTGWPCLLVCLGDFWRTGIMFRRLSFSTV